MIINILYKVTMEANDPFTKLPHHNVLDRSVGDKGWSIFNYSLLGEEENWSLMRIVAKLNISQRCAHGNVALAGNWRFDRPAVYPEIPRVLNMYTLTGHRGAVFAPDWKELADWAMNSLDAPFWKREACNLKSCTEKIADR